MKSIMLTIAISATVLGIFAQSDSTSKNPDIIHLQNGKALEVNIIEVGAESVSFKAKTGDNSTVQNIPLSEVSSINFKDGGEQNFYGFKASGKQRRRRGLSGKDVGHIATGVIVAAAVGAVAFTALFVYAVLSSGGDGK